MPVLVAVILAFLFVNSSSACKCFPGDACWPTTAQWDVLNKTVDGRLIATVPLGQPCHDPYYNAETCTSLQSQWQDPPIQYVICSYDTFDGIYA